MTPEHLSSEDGRDTDREFDTTSGGLNDETAVSVRAARLAAPTAVRGSLTPPNADEGDDVAGGEETTSTVRVDRAPRPAVPRYSAPPDGLDDTVARPRSSRIPDDATIRVRRTTAEPAPEDAPDEQEADPDDSSSGAEREAGGEGGTEASADPKPTTRAAYTPDPLAIAEGYAARPAAPFIGSRAAHPLRMAQPAIDGEAVDRSIRGKARRRAVSLGAAVAFAILVAACLLAALLASFTH